MVESTERKITTKEKADNLETAAYLLALTAARDQDSSKDLDKAVLAKIRDMLANRLILTGANPNILILQTVGMSEEEGLECAKKFEEEGLV